MQLNVRKNIIKKFTLFDNFLGIMRASTVNFAWYWHLKVLQLEPPTYSCLLH